MIDKIKVQIDIIKTDIDIIKTKLLIFAGGMGGSITYLSEGDFIGKIAIFSLIITFYGTIKNIKDLNFQKEKLQNLEKEIK